ncbi:hypothetical protein ElyMa_006958200 [Elysia marginata]|uniref:Uncharacterized protein n=1 Tax=Elysia marginata TaxID=1093978 RepID=A0AAV4JMU2_9GAST|nr:hypothetical protein ElyMa_006958200 [Elysia marginata]
MKVSSKQMASSNGEMGVSKHRPSQQTIPRQRILPNIQYPEEVEDSPRNSERASENLPGDDKSAVEMTRNDSQSVNLIFVMEKHMLCLSFLSLLFVRRRCEL